MTPGERVLMERQAVAIYAARRAGGEWPTLGSRVVRLDRAIPLTYGPRGYTSKRSGMFHAGEPVEVLLDCGVVVLDRVRHDPADGHARSTLVWTEGIVGGYARWRMRRPASSQSWRRVAGGWWRPVGRPEMEVWHDWADASPDWRPRPAVGQCRMRRDGSWEQAPGGPSGAESPTAVVLAWQECDYQWPTGSWEAEQGARLQRRGR